MATISTHNGSKAHRDHNIRNEKITSKEAHINPNGIHEIWLDELPRQAYHRLFDESQKKYNEKQTRDDRKIKDYFNQIKNDQKKHLVYEMIIGIYGGQNEQTCKEIMKEFVDDWKKRNSNLEMIGAYYHNDEQGEPHVHIDYIPIAHGYSRGMEVQTGLVKGLGEMGFEKKGKLTAQIQWEKRENQCLEELCKKRGIEVEHPDQEKSEHLSTKNYKLIKENESLEAKYEKFKEEVEIGELTKKAIENITVKKKLFKDDIVEISKENYSELKAAAIRLSNIENIKSKLDMEKFQLKLDKKKINEKLKAADFNLNRSIKILEKCKSLETLEKNNFIREIEELDKGVKVLSEEIEL